MAVVLHRRGEGQGLALEANEADVELAVDAHGEVADEATVGDEVDDVATVARLTAGPRTELSGTRTRPRGLLRAC